MEGSADSAFPRTLISCSVDEARSGVSEDSFRVRATLPNFPDVLAKNSGSEDLPVPTRLVDLRPGGSELAPNLAARKISWARIGRGNAIICVDVDVHPAGPDCRN